jgi:predicted GIY-YIG superfamily endonuclease
MLQIYPFLDCTLYARITVHIGQNTQLRLKEHNTGKSRYTRGHLPWRLFYSEYVGESVLAREKEKYFKSSAGKRKLRAILELEK